MNQAPNPGKAAVRAEATPEPYKNPGRAWIIARKHAGLEGVRLHDLRHSRDLRDSRDLRHSYASLAAGRGVSLQMIGKFLGHKVSATTQRFLDRGGD